MGAPDETTRRRRAPYAVKKAASATAAACEDSLMRAKAAGLDSNKSVRRQNHPRRGAVCAVPNVAPARLFDR